MAELTMSLLASLSVVASRLVGSKWRAVVYLKSLWQRGFHSYLCGCKSEEISCLRGINEKCSQRLLNYACGEIQFEKFVRCELYDYFLTNFSSVIAGLFDVFLNPNTVTFLSLQFLCRSILHLHRVRSVLESLGSFCVKVSSHIDQEPCSPHYSALRSFFN